MGAIPSTWRPSGWYGKVDASQNIGNATGKPRLIIAQKTAAGSATVDVPVLVTSVSQAIALFGVGSHGHLMVKATLAQNRVTPLWVIPVTDGTTAATGTITVAVTTALAGTGHFLLAGQPVKVAVSAGDADSAIATALAAAINAAIDLPVTAAAALAVVTLTAKNKGTLGNAIDIRENYYGVAGGEETPGGVTFTVVAMASGATDPSLTTAIAAMSDTEYDYIASALVGATELTALGVELNDTDDGRWGPLRQVYGHLFGAMVDSLSNLTTFGSGRNDQHVSIMGMPSMPSPPWELAAALMGAAARSLADYPANPIAKGALVGIIGPAPADVFQATERNTLLSNGIATGTVSPTGDVRVDICATTYQTDNAGNDDDSYFQVQTLATNQAMMRRWKQRASKWDEYVIVADDKRIRAGVKKVTTLKKVSNSVFIAGYREFIGLGWAENMDAFKAALTTSLVGGRIVADLPPDLANPLRQFDITLSFRLDFAA